MTETGSSKWVRVASTGEIGEGEILAVTVGDAAIAVYHLEGGEYRATDNICTHEYACLSDGWLEGGVVECPLHAGQFDVRTGKGLGPPIEADLKVYAVRVEGDDVLVEVAGGA